jgi:hypothetical protein
MRRLDDGQPLRDAMTEAGLSIPDLAARTRELDPEGKGLSPAFIGFYVSTGTSARETISTRSASLIARAVDHPVDSLFGDT